MMNKPRLRMVAGPNGSGKSTLLGGLGAKFDLQFCLNPDLLEAALVKHRRMDFGQWGLVVEEQTLRGFLLLHALGGGAMADAVRVQANVLSVGTKFKPGYFVSALCDFMRRQWLAARVSFTFETVMSSRDKVDFLREAQGADYRTYLYYICTESPVINRERVAVRVRQGGHGVAEEKIALRYERSLGLLPEAIACSSRAYLFDNSGPALRLIAEFEDAKLIQVGENLPAWFVKSVLTHYKPEDHTRI